MDKFYFYFILFLIYSFIGWAIEVCVTFPKYKKFLNRRIFKAYPKYKINIIKILEEYRKEKIEKK